MGRDSGPAVKVLLVEDHPQIAKLRAELFENLGCQVSAAESVQDAIAELSSPAQFDIVMTDINLGEDLEDQSGLELARWIRDSDPDLPIVAYTAVFNESDLPMDRHPEIAQWIVKGSLGLADLRDAMEGVVRLGREARSVREK